MISPNHSFYWYKVILSKGGTMQEMAGDIPGNNPMHAMLAIEEMNLNTWEGSLMSVRLHDIDWNTGVISEDPVIHWTRYDHKDNPLSMNVDWDPSEYDKPTDTSHSVMFEAHKLGSTMKTDNTTFQTTIPKEL